MAFRSIRFRERLQLCETMVFQVIFIQQYDESRLSAAYRYVDEAPTFFAVNEFGGRVYRIENDRVAFTALGAMHSIDSDFSQAGVPQELSYQRPLGAKWRQHQDVLQGRDFC